MMMWSVHKSLLCVCNPFVSGDFPARITEATFAGVSDIMFCFAFFTNIQTVTEFFFVSTVHHFFDIFFYRIADFVYT